MAGAKSEKMKELINKLDVQRVVSVLSGSSFDHKNFTVCPFPDHHENTGSFYTIEKTNTFYCWGCSRGGKPFDFFMFYNGLSYSEAMELLGEFKSPEELFGVRIKQSNNYGSLDNLSLSSEHINISVNFDWVYPNGNINKDKVSTCRDKILADEVQLTYYLYKGIVPDNLLKMLLDMAECKKNGVEYVADGVNADLSTMIFDTDIDFSEV